MHKWHPKYASLLAKSYHCFMVHRTTVVLDQRKLARARKLLGTKGIRETLEAALDEVIALEERKKAVEQLRTLDGLDLDDPDVMAKAWR